MLQARQLSGREEINLKLITWFLALVLSLLMPDCIKHKLTETGFTCESELCTFLSWLKLLVFVLRLFSISRLRASNVLYFKEKAKPSKKWQLNSYNSMAFIVLYYTEEQNQKLFKAPMEFLTEGKCCTPSISEDTSSQPVCGAPSQTV